MLISVTIHYGPGMWGKAHEVSEEGDIARAVADTIDHFRRENPEVSLFDAKISLSDITPEK